MCSIFTVKSKQLLPASPTAVLTLSHYTDGTHLWFYVFLFKGGTQTCRHGAVHRGESCRVDSPVASALWIFRLASTRTVRSDTQTLPILIPAHPECRRGECRHERASFLFLPLGLIVASALVDVSQQKSDFKDKSQSLKSRKALPLAHQGTCV